MKPLTGFLLTMLYILAVAVWVITAGTLSPYTSSVGPKVLFFGSLCIIISGLLAVVLLLIRRQLYHGRNFRPWLSIRQGFLVGLVATALLLLQVNGLLGIWEVVPLLVAAACAEAFFQADRLRGISPYPHPAPDSTPEHGSAPE
jgi:hypothetical protein